MVEPSPEINESLNDEHLDNVQPSTSQDIENIDDDDTKEDVVVDKEKLFNTIACTFGDTIHLFDDPVKLPCRKYACSKCLWMANPSDKTIKCPYCKKRHNKTMKRCRTKLIQNKIDRNLLLINECFIEKTEKSATELRDRWLNHEEIINNKINYLNEEVEIESESKKIEIEIMKDDLIADYKDRTKSTPNNLNKCIEAHSAKIDEIKKFIDIDVNKFDQPKFYLSHVRYYMKELKSIEKKLTETLNRVELVEPEEALTANVIGEIRTGSINFNNKFKEIKRMNKIKFDDIDNMRIECGTSLTIDSDSNVYILCSRKRMIVKTDIECTKMIKYCELTRKIIDNDDDDGYERHDYEFLDICVSSNRYIFVSSVKSRRPVLLCLDTELNFIKKLTIPTSSEYGFHMRRHHYGCYIRKYGMACYTNVFDDDETNGVKMKLYFNFNKRIDVFDLDDKFEKLVIHKTFGPPNADDIFDYYSSYTANTIKVAQHFVYVLNQKHGSIDIYDNKEFKFLRSVKLSTYYCRHVQTFLGDDFGNVIFISRSERENDDDLYLYSVNNDGKLSNQTILFKKNVCSMACDNVSFRNYRLLITVKQRGSAGDATIRRRRRRSYFFNSPTKSEIDDKSKEDKDVQEKEKTKQNELLWIYEFDKQDSSVNPTSTTTTNTATEPTAK